MRSAGAGLALALLLLTYPLHIVLPASPAAALAQGAPVISSASPADSGFGQPPQTRISRPHAVKDSAPTGNGQGDDIKLLPAKPIADPIEPPPGSPAPGANSVPAGNGPAYPPQLNSQMNRPGGQASAPSAPVQLGPGGEDPYPTIGKLENITVGASQPTTPITDRLAKLENTVFKRVYASESLFDRTDRLKKTLLGPDYIDPNSAAGRDRDDLLPLGNPAGLGFSPGGMPSGLGVMDPSLLGLDMPPALNYLDEVASKPENREACTPEMLSQFALELVNYERRNAGLGPLGADKVAEGVAGAHVQELAKRAALSHFSLSGDNPDRRYTLAGGNDAMVESVASARCAELGSKKLTKAALARTIKSLLTRQDDRDALMSPDASQLGFAMALSSSNDKILSVFEVVSHHGVIESLPAEVAVGEKLEIKGVIEAPYVFDRITVAWEAYNGSGSTSTPDESEDALPYFPPLDYIAYARKSDRDFSKAIFALKAAGVVAAIAGGMFVPPVALAAPLIIMSGNGGAEPRPVSDIPVKGGVKVDGSNFDARIPISNSNKEGLYYITIYGALGSHAQQSVAISRRVVLAKLMPKGEGEPAGKVPVKIDPEVKADIEPGSGTAGGGDDKDKNKSKDKAGKAGENKAANSIGGSTAEASAVSKDGTLAGNGTVFTPESKQEGRADAPAKN